MSVPQLIKQSHVLYSDQSPWANKKSIITHVVAILWIDRFRFLFLHQPPVSKHLDLLKCILSLMWRCRAKDMSGSIARLSAL